VFDERRRPMGREGFTLIEVLMAMVILAVGLLALEAMGIGAARAVARADERSAYTALATDELERALARVSATSSPVPDTRTVGGANVATVVDSVRASNRMFFTVTVTVTPPASVRNRLGLSATTVVGRATR
jgi:type IV pilus modification protein PilV